MKLLTIRVNQRINHTVNFEGSSQRVEDFILQRSEGNPIVLFSLYRLKEKSSKQKKDLNGMIDVVSQGNQACCAMWVHLIYDEQISDSEEADNDNQTQFSALMPSHKLHVVLGDVEKEAEIKLGNNFSFDRDSCRLSYCGPDSLINISVDFDYKRNDGVDKTVTMSLFVGLKENITDVVLDFGSESSQMAIFNRGESQTGNQIQNITELMMRNFWPPKDNHHKEDEFRQYESAKLFRSIFYVKEKLTPQTFIGIKNETKPQNKALRVLSLKIGDEMKQGNSSYLTIPNTKICDFGVFIPEIIVSGARKSISEDNVLPNACIHPFIYAALMQIHNANAVNKRHLVTLRMLMPNVYSHRRTVRMIHDMADYAKRLITKDSKLRKTIFAVQVSAVSESDASLIGLVTNDRSGEFRKGNYLILDAGKGTLDFSVMNYDGSQKFDNLYRSGIIGAGNAITYAYFLCLLEKYIRENVDLEDVSIQDAMRSFIYYGILGNAEYDASGHKVIWKTQPDLAILHRMISNVDDFKKGKVNTMLSTSSSTNKAKIREVRLDTLTRWIACQNPMSLSSDDDLRYVNEIIESIAAEVGVQIGLFARANEINYLVFTGRAFGCKRFLEAIKSRLEKRNQSSKTNITVKYNNISNLDYNKHVCLFISSTLNQGGYNHHIFSKPFSLQLIQDAEKKSENQTKSMKDSESFFHKKYEKLVKKIADSGIVDIFIPQPGDGQTSQNQSFETATENPCVNGFAIRKNGSDTINVAGTLYTPLRQPGNITGDRKNLQVSLFYEGEHIWVRCNQETCDLDETDEVRHDFNLKVFESLFPYCQVDDISKVPLEWKSQPID